MKVTLSVIKADIGGYVGHSESHPDVIAKASDCLAKAKKDGLLIDCQATKCGDDLQLVMTHQKVAGKQCRLDLRYGGVCDRRRHASGDRQRQICRVNDLAIR